MRSRLGKDLYPYWTIVGSHDLKVFCGIDWAEQHHDVALVNDQGQLVAKKRITETVDGFAELVEMLAAAGD
jgi:hypothetical protein